MAKFKEAAPEYWQFNCPGCNQPHFVKTNPGGWQFNKDQDRPTVSPSIFVNQGGLNPTAPICHSFVRDGKIQFLTDCTHALAGQTVELPDV